MKRASSITWEQVRVGLVVLVALGILLIGGYKLGQAANLFSKRYTLVAFLPNANGLRTGGSVTVAGQLAGVVQSIDFLPVDADTTRNLRVVVAVDERLRSQVRGDSKGRLKTLGLLGDKVFDISPGTPRYSPLRPGDTLPVAESLDYDQVLAKAAGAVDDVVGLTQDLHVITGGLANGEGTVGQMLTNRRLYDELTGTLGRANVMIGRLQNPNGSIGMLINDPTLYRNMTHMVASVDSLVLALQSGQGTAGKLLKDDSLYTKLVDIASGADSLVRLARTGNGLAAKLLNDQTLYDQLNKTLTDLNALLSDVRRDPKKFTKGLIKVF
jgi:phospholipid/cholesterol/gamma-HCH transport system substrate-binding protein